MIDGEILHSHYFYFDFNPGIDLLERLQLGWLSLEP